MSGDAGARGLFVTLEGGEGSGKSTQLKALARLGRRDNFRVVTCREPGGTTLGEALRELLFSGDAPATSTELLMFAAARAQLVEEVIRPALANGALVICDRFADSTLAYQHYGRGLDLDQVRAVNQVATGGLQPDLTLLLDLDPTEGVARTSTRRDGGEFEDYLERETLAFHRAVRLGFLELAAAEPDRWLVLDATKPVMQVTHAAWERITAVAAERR
ncbi:MAG: dTMP kinase [Dehalococcoidia bacterium]|nr:dTMP kinase [Dehalococcoidia bacterium]